MINSSFTVGPEAIGQIAGIPSGQSLVRRTDDTSGANAGFLGMLLALFARPLSTGLPVMPETNTGQPETDRGTLGSDNSAMRGNVIFSGDQTGPVTVVAAPAGQTPENAAPLLPGEPDIVGLLTPESRGSAVPVSGEAGFEIPALSGSNSGGVDAMPAQVRGLQAWVSEDSAGWAKEFQVTGRRAYGDVPVWNATGPASGPGQAKQMAVNAGRVANLLELNQETEPAGVNAHLGGTGSFTNRGTEPVSVNAHLGGTGGFTNQGAEPVSVNAHLGRAGGFSNQGAEPVSVNAHPGGTGGFSNQGTEPVSVNAHLGRAGGFTNQGTEPVGVNAHLGGPGGFSNQGTEPVGVNAHLGGPGGFSNQGTEPVGVNAHLGRAGIFFGDELIRVAEGSDGTTQSRTLEAFARMAKDSTGLRQTVLDNTAGRVATVLRGQGVVSIGEVNGVSLTADRSEAVLASLVKLASTRRVEPVVTREDVENAIVFSAPRGTASPAGESAPAGEVWARSVVSRVHDETVGARAAGKTSVSFDITTANGDSVRVRIAMRSNVVSGRIGVMDSETKDVLALHIPELNRRLEMENLIPERFDVYVMNEHGEGGRRRQQRKPRWTADRPDEQEAEDNFIYVSSEVRGFEKWA